MDSKTIILVGAGAMVAYALFGGVGVVLFGVAIYLFNNK